MQIEVIERDNYDIMKISGSIKLGESKEMFVKHLQSELKKKPNCLMIDFADVNYIDSNGIGELVGYLDKFKEVEAKLVLLGLQVRVRDLLRITKLDNIFPIFLNEQEAAASLQLK